MQLGGDRRAAWQDKAAQRCQTFVDLVDFGFKPFDLARGDPKRAFRAPSIFGRAEVGAEIEEIVLNTAQCCIQFLVRTGAGDFDADKTDHGVGFVDCTVGFDSRVMLRDTVAVAKDVSPGRRRACIFLSVVPLRPSGDHHNDGEQQQGEALQHNSRAHDPIACLRLKSPPRAIVKMPKNSTPKVASMAKIINGTRNPDIQAA